MIQHLDGNCHVYLEEEADPNKALKIVENAKTQRYGTCNTAESLLVDRSVAAMLLPPIAHMLTNKGVEIRGCAETCALVKEAVPATEEDYYTEFLAPIISVKVVAGIDEAIARVNHRIAGLRPVPVPPVPVLDGGTGPSRDGLDDLSGLRDLRSKGVSPQHHAAEREAQA